ncbi:MAG: hypothetical protein D6801_04075 [Alphaproteobacteria bacterium]|nr:MAG: hypothetical protein D6801_04075 [Alphaproteobacteria bacterium]
MGGTGGDKLFGGKGADTLAGDTGGDRLYGGKDNARDVFVYSDASDSPSDSSQTDKVFDFVSGVDVFDFRWMDADTSTDAHDDFAFSATGPAAHRVWTQSVDGGSLVMADNTGDALADLVVFVSDVSHLDVGDFWLSTPGG